MSQLKTDEDSLDWGRKTYGKTGKHLVWGGNRQEFTSGYSLALQGSEQNHLLLSSSGWSRYW